MIATSPTSEKNLRIVFIDSDRSAVMNEGADDRHSKATHTSVAASALLTIRGLHSTDEANGPHPS